MSSGSKLSPDNQGCQGRPFRDNRKVVETIIYRYRTRACLP